MNPDYRAARLNMVESQVRTADVTDLAIQDAMRVVAREDFCGPRAHLAYADADVEYAPGRFLLKPRDVAKLLQGIRPREGERALAIAAPYAAEVLRQMGLTVESAEAPPADAAFDVIICEMAVAEAPSAWLDALAVGGRLGVIERQGPVGKARLYLRSQDDVGGRTLFDATAPYLFGHEPRKSFAF
jgi:protein-L-isoaspartate(D-aspartate) O-methyltransferase